MTKCRPVTNQITLRQAMTSTAFLPWVGFVQKVRVSGSGLGIVDIMVLRLILWSFCVIPFHARGQS